ncbi:TPA: hypothetical protein DCZ32_00760 [Candidatus Uhrbacteria bacterium]|nr:hypothetical protein [Candidatus Uhrbacteria bacterium]
MTKTNTTINNGFLTLDDYTKDIHGDDMAKKQDIYEDDYDINLSVNIFNARRARGFTQSALAEALGTKQPNVARFESGAIQPSHDMFKKIARILGFRPVAPDFVEDQPTCGVTTVKFSLKQVTTSMDIKNPSIITPQYAFSN